MRESLLKTVLPAAVLLWIHLLLPGQAVGPLPEGKGLAAAFYGDQGVASHPSVLFTDDFEDPSALERWDHVWANGGSGEITGTPLPAEAGGHSYRTTILRPGPQAASVGIRKFLPPGHDTLFFRYYAMYEKGIEIYHGGTHNAGSIAARLPGELYESHAGVYPNGHNIYSVILDTWRPDGDVPSPGDMAFYCYHMDQGHQWGDHFFPSGRILPGGRELFGADFLPRPDFIPETGEWHCYEMMIMANTPGKRDGRVAFWVDGVLKGDFPNLRFRETALLKPNRIALNLYTHNPLNTSNLVMWFDDVVAATDYIGPKERSGLGHDIPGRAMTATK